MKMLACNNVLQDHSVPIDEYKEKYGNAGFAYVDHTCKLCQKKVIFIEIILDSNSKHVAYLRLKEDRSFLKKIRFVTVLDLKKMP